MSKNDTSLGQQECHSEPNVVILNSFQNINKIGPEINSGRHVNNDNTCHSELCKVNQNFQFCVNLHPKTKSECVSGSIFCF